MWHAFIELIQALTFAVAHVCGGNVGAAIAVVSFTVRLALVPWTRRMMRRAHERQAVLARLKPQLDRLQKRYANDQRRLAEETLALYKANGVRMFDPQALVGYAILAPLFGGLYGAVRAGLGAGKRFLWVADLARPDAAMALVASALVGLSIALGRADTAEAARMLRFSALLAAGTTLSFLFSASGAMAVSVAAGALAPRGLRAMQNHPRRSSVRDSR